MCGQSKLMKVLLLTDSDVFAGTERHLLDLATALQAQGRDVTVACPASGLLALRVQKAGLPFWPVEKGIAVDLKAIAQIVVALRAERFDIVHAHNGRTALVAVLASALARRGAVVLTQHFIAPNHATERGWKARLKHRLHVWLHRRATRTIAISAAVGEGMERRCEVSGAQWVKVWNGIPDPACNEIRAAAVVGGSLPAGAAVFLCIARLEVEKGIPLLIQALEQMKQCEVPWKCFIAGEGSMRQGLEAIVRAAELTDRIVFLGFREDVQSLLQATDLLVLPSPAEPFGLVLLEAMAMAKPVVALASGGPLEIVDHERTGLLVPTENPQALAGALQRLAKHQALRAAFGRIGRERYLSLFTSDRMARETWDVYQGALADRCLSPEATRT